MNLRYFSNWFHAQLYIRKEISLFSVLKQVNYWSMILYRHSMWLRFTWKLIPELNLFDFHQVWSVERKSVWRLLNHLDGGDLAIGLQNGMIWIFDVVGNGDFQLRIDGREQYHNAPVTDVIWSMDSSYLLGVYEDNYYNICKWKTNARLNKDCLSRRVDSIVRFGERKKYSKYSLASSGSSDCL